MHIIVAVCFTMWFKSIWERHNMLNETAWRVLLRNKVVLKPWVSPAFAITYFYNHWNISPTPMVIHERMWIQLTIFQNLTNRSMTPRWPLTPFCCGHICDCTKGSFYPSPMKICQSMWIQWPFFSPKTWSKGHWPLDDLWPQVCWGHKCDFNQGSLCPRPMEIHQCMWIQWSILQNTTYAYILHTTYILRTAWVIT